MLSGSSLFRLLSEAIILLLGALLILIAISRPVMLPARPSALVALGLFLVYWGIRAWLRREKDVPPWQSRMRGGSLALVGLLIAAIPRLPFHDSGLVLGVSGGVLVIRGLVACVALALSAPPKAN